MQPVAPSPKRKKTMPAEIDMMGAMAIAFRDAHCPDALSPRPFLPLTTQLLAAAARPSCCRKSPQPTHSENEIAQKCQDVSQSEYAEVMQVAE